LPQSPSKAALEEFEEIDVVEDIGELVQRLGNLALAEQPINIHLGNRPYSEKKAVYPQSQFLLTQAISRKPQLGTNTSVDRAVKELEPYEDWCSSAIDGRQATLTILARKVWDVPETDISLFPADFVSEEIADLRTGGYRSGSAIYDLYTRLADEQWHPLEELRKITSGRADFDSRLDRIKRRGRHRSLWSIQEQNGKLRMRFTGSATAANA
jgi:hypothetical protein